MMTWQTRQVLSVPITEAIAQCSAVDPDETLLKTAPAMDILI